MIKALSRGLIRLVYVHALSLGLFPVADPEGDPMVPFQIKPCMHRCDSKLLTRGPIVSSS